MSSAKFTAINGVLLLNKDLGVSSNRALQEVRRLFNARKAGHTGSLDPLATGVLPICFGEATKFTQYLLDADKTYLVTIKLGITTTTADSEGAIIATKPVPTYTVTQLQSCMQDFIGVTQQVPPMYSALKHNGQPLYKLARQGLDVSRAARTVQIYAFELLEYVDDTLRCKVHCSKGTYIRTLAEDLGDKLGCGAHITQLQRTATAGFTLEMARTYHELVTNDELLGTLLPMDCLLQGLSQFNLSVEDAVALRHGKEVRITLPVADNAVVCVRDQDGQLLGTAVYNEGGVLRASRLLST